MRWEVLASLKLDEINQGGKVKLTNNKRLVANTFKF